MNGSIFDALGGIGANPLVQGLLGLGAGFGQAAGPSRMPVPLGAAFGAGAQGLMGGLTNAAKLRMLMEQEKRLGTQNELAKQELELKSRQDQRAQDFMGRMPGLFGAGGAQPAATEAAPASAPAQPPANAQEFIARFTPHAMAVAQETGLDPRLVLAQAGLETGWGTKAPGNNYFGIKGEGQTLNTQESVNGQMVPQRASFRAYQSPEESFRDYAAFIKANPRYAGVMQAQGLDNQIKAMGASGYATDPNYGGKLQMMARGIQIPESAQPVAAPQQEQAQPAAAPAPIAALPPQAQNIIKQRGDQAWQQASQMQMMAAYAGMNPQLAHVAPILMKRSEQMLQQNAWMPTTLPNGMKGYVNAFTGEAKELSQPRTVEAWQNGQSVRMLDQPGVTSQAPPAAPVPLLRNGQQEMVEPNSGRSIGIKPMSLDEQSAAGVQSGQRGVTPSQAITQGAASRAGAERIATNTAEEWKTTRAAAMDAGQRVAVLDRVEQALGNFPPGALADKKLWLGQMASQMGLPDLVNASEGEILKGLRSRVQLALTPRGQGQITESERGLIGAQFEVMMSTPQGAREMIGMIRRLDQIDMDVAKIYADNAERNGGAPNPIEVQREVQAYLQANPKPVVPNVAPQQAPSRAANRRWNVQKGAWE